MRLNRAFSLGGNGFDEGIFQFRRSFRKILLLRGADGKQSLEDAEQYGLADKVHGQSMEKS
jgi:hypothetical protein